MVTKFQFDTNGNSVVTWIGDRSPVALHIPEGLGSGVTAVSVSLCRDPGDVLPHDVLPAYLDGAAFEIAIPDDTPAVVLLRPSEWVRGGWAKLTASGATPGSVVYLETVGL